MKQKVVIKVSMNDEKCRKKAMKTVVGHSGVISTSIQGQEKNLIEVVGVGIDAAVLTSSLRKIVGHAVLESVSPVDDKKEGDKKNDETKSTQPQVIWTANPYVYSDFSSHPYVYTAAPTYYCEARDPSYDNNCTIM